MSAKPARHPRRPPVLDTVAALKAALTALVSDGIDPVWLNDEYMICNACGRKAPVVYGPGLAQVWHEVDHKPDCPVAVAKRLLGMDTTEGNDDD